MTPMHKLELAIQTLKARMDDQSVIGARKEAAIAGATEVLAEAALEALPAIEIMNFHVTKIMNAKNECGRQEVAA